MFDLVRTLHGDRFFDGFRTDFRAPLRVTVAGTPTPRAPADVLEGKDGLVVRMDVPGLRPEDIDVKIEDDVLTVRAERKLDERAGETWHRAEIAYGAFARTFALPTTVNPDKIDAKVEHGVLTITLPKREEAKPRTISVKAR